MENNVRVIRRHLLLLLRLDQGVIDLIDQVFALLELLLHMTLIGYRLDVLIIVDNVVRRHPLNDLNNIRPTGTSMPHRRRRPPIVVVRLIALINIVVSVRQYHLLLQSLSCKYRDWQL